MQLRLSWHILDQPVLSWEGEHVLQESVVLYNMHEFSIQQFSSYIHWQEPSVRRTVPLHGTVRLLKQLSDRSLQVRKERTWLLPIWRYQRGNIGKVSKEIVAHFSTKF